MAQQLETLRQQQPECVAVIVTFGAEVCVHTDGGSRSLVARRAHAAQEDLLAKGHELCERCMESVAEAAERLGSTVASLKPCGYTALGPALAIGVGMASGRLGSKIVLFTDGMANNGVGAVQKGILNPFYTDMGRRAGEEGTCISVITMEGEDCSMENLGTCADLTVGQVDMVDLQALSAKVGSMLANPIIGTNLEVTVITGAGVSLDSHAAPAQRGAAWVGVHTQGNATAKTYITFDLHASVGQASECGSSVPVQLQLRFNRPNGEAVLHVVSMQRAITGSREEAESDINGTGIALRGIHSAARMAQQGEYRAARVLLISTCRLLQRAMRTFAHQESYLSFVVQAEKLDGFMRERESQDKVFGVDGNSQRGRDDDASRSMYQMKGLSVEEFASRA